MELLACPFCGKLGHSERRAEGWIVRCSARYEDCCINGRTHHCTSLKQAIAAWNTRSTESAEPEVVALAALREALEKETRRFDWEGDESLQEKTRLRACKERRKQWGDGDCDRDGTCDECVSDMAAELETDASRARRCRARQALASALAAMPAPIAESETPPDFTQAGLPVAGAGQHTPGPWQFGHLGNEALWIGPTYHETPVAHVDHDMEYARDNSIANARLIAAAPEMAEALRRCLNYLENTEGEFGITLDSADFARCVLAKIGDAA